MLDCFVGSGTTAFVPKRLELKHRSLVTLAGLPSTQLEETVATLALRVRLLSEEVSVHMNHQASQAAAFPSNGKIIWRNKENENCLSTVHSRPFRATPISGHASLHDTKAGRMVMSAQSMLLSLGRRRGDCARHLEDLASGKDSPTELGADNLGPNLP